MKILDLLLGTSLLILGSGCDKIMFSEATQYAPQFSEGAFKRLRKGTPLAVVTNLLGSPLAEGKQEWVDIWLYQPQSALESRDRRGQYVYDLFGPFTRF